MKLFFKKNYQEILLIAVMGSMGYLWYLERHLYPSGGAPLIGVAYGILGFMLVMGIAWMVHSRMQQIERVQDWHIDAVNLHIKRFQEDIQDIQNHANEHTHPIIFDRPEHEDNADNADAVETPLLTEESAKASEKHSSHWPWGNHHTATLGHLEAAALRFWRLYDPGDIGTAPTNDMVATWLQNERGISKEKARAIASMLRPDGLPTGPRR